MRLKMLLPNLYHFKFKTQYDVTMTFMRVQEFYESTYSSIRGKYFTHEDYMDKCAEMYGNFIYSSHWTGFNINGSSIRNFYSKFKEKPFWKKEERLFGSLKKVLKNKDNFYVIGTYLDEDVDHEISHAFYYLFPDYKMEMDDLISTFRSKNKFFKMLREDGYSSKVLKDEIQAYLATSKVKYMKEKFNYPINDSVKEFRKIFKKYKKRYIC